MLRSSQYKLLVAITLMMLGCFACLGYHLYDLQVRRHLVLCRIANDYTRARAQLEPWRGEVRDRHGVKLALSVPEKTVCLSLEVCGDDTEAVASTCAMLLRLPCERVRSAILFAQHHLRPGGKAPPQSIELKHHVSLEEWTAVASAVRLESFGYHLGKLAPKEESKLFKLRHHLLSANDSQARLYPFGETLATLLGYCSPADNGLGLEGNLGLEATYNSVLAGTFGDYISEKDAAGNELPLQRSVYHPATNGAHVQLTIDLPLQQMLESELAAAVTQSQARAGCAVIMDPSTFEILAMAGVPSFDPKKPMASQPQDLDNQCMTVLREPGSVAKMFTLAAALESKLVTLEKSVNCENGQCLVAGVRVRDHAPLGVLTVKEAFARSSNIGFAKIGAALGPLRLYQCMTNFGLGQPSGIPFFGATRGRVIAPTNKSMTDLTRAAFGQGIKTTQLQLAIAVSVIVNEGRLFRPLLVRQIESPDGKILRKFEPQFVRQVVSPATAQQLREAFKAVVASGGTATAAASPQYSCGVKTGTAQKADTNGYIVGAYYSSVIGFMPAEAPRLVIAVALDEPRNGYYAGTVVAPWFRAIAEQSAALLGIPPDKAVAARAARARFEVRPTPSIHAASTSTPRL